MLDLLQMASNMHWQQKSIQLVCWFLLHLWHTSSTAVVRQESQLQNLVNCCSNYVHLFPLSSTDVPKCLARYCLLQESNWQNSFIPGLIVTCPRSALLTNMITSTGVSSGPTCPDCNLKIEIKVSSFTEKNSAQCEDYSFKYNLHSMFTSVNFMLVPRFVLGC